MVPIAVVQRRPSLVATMDAERQETLRSQSLCNSMKKEASIPVIAVTCDDSEEEEEDEIKVYGFIPLEEQNTNIIQEDSLEQNNTEFDILRVEGIEDIPSVNIIPPSLPQSPQKGEQFITDAIDGCTENEIQFNEKEGDDASNSTTISTSSGDPLVLEGIENAAEEDDHSIRSTNQTNPCNFVLNKSKVQSAKMQMKMEAVVVEIPASATISTVVSPGSGANASEQSCFNVTTVQPITTASNINVMPSLESFDSKHMSRAWKVCWRTTTLILLFLLFLWFYFENKTDDQ